MLTHTFRSRFPVRILKTCEWTCSPADALVVPSVPAEFREYHYKIAQLDIKDESDG